MASIGLAASDPMGLWAFASHIRTITVMGTTVRLLAPTVPTGRGASDPMGLRSFAGHISANNRRGDGEQGPKLNHLTVAVRMSALGGTGISPSTIQQPSTSVPCRTSPSAFIQAWSASVYFPTYSAEESGHETSGVSVHR
jgi:hypothetical protein